MAHLNEKLPIGRRTAPNRLVNQPMECNDADERGNPSDLTFSRYRKLAQGGAGIIFIEALTITWESRARKNQLGIYGETAAALAKLIREMKELNRDSLILLQITHSGVQSGTGFSRLVSVYPVADPRFQVLTAEEIEAIGDQFAQAARIAREVGADGIDFKHCHGYMCAEMLRPANTRGDRFGGSFENRSRFFRDTSQKIRDAVGHDPAFLIGVRYSVYEGIPGGFGTAGPGEVIEDLAEPLAFARLAEQAGMDYINVSGGIPAITPEIVRPTKFYPEGVYRHFGWARAVKKKVSVPVIASGYSYLRDGDNALKEADPRKKSFASWAEKNLSDGICDLVGIGRQSLADPLFAQKILGGRIGEIDYCLACGGCSTLLRSQLQVGCPIHDPFYKEILKKAPKQK